MKIWIEKCMYEGKMEPRRQGEDPSCTLLARRHSIVMSGHDPDTGHRPVDMRFERAMLTCH